MNREEQAVVEAFFRLFPKHQKGVGYILDATIKHPQPALDANVKDVLSGAVSKGELSKAVFNAWVAEDRSGFSLNRCRISAAWSLISERQVEEDFIPDDWNSFYSKHRSAAGIASITKPVIVGNEALLYADNHWASLQGWGRFFLFRLASGRWVQVRQFSVREPWDPKISK